MDLMSIENYFKQLLNREDVTEILCNGFKNLFLSSHSGPLRIESVFRSEIEMTRWMQDYAFSHGLRLDPLYPCNGGMDSSTKYRWHAALKEVAPDGPLFVFRKLFGRVFSLNDFVVDVNFKSKIQEVFKSNFCILFSGSTSSGKTSLLSACLNQFCMEERVLILETHQELFLASDYWCRLVEPDPDREKRKLFELKDLLRHTLRLKPDRLVLGEIRGSEANVFFEASLSGHESCAATIHANSPEQALLKLKRLCLESGVHHSEGQWNEFMDSISLAVVQMERGFPPKVQKLVSFQGTQKKFIEI